MTVCLHRSLSPCVKIFVCDPVSTSALCAIRHSWKRAGCFGRTILGGVCVCVLSAPPVMKLRVPKVTNCYTCWKQEQNLYKWGYFFFFYFFPPYDSILLAIYLSLPDINLLYKSQPAFSLNGEEYTHACIGVRLKIAF